MGFRARGIADRLHALDIGIRDIRQILNPLRDISHALNRREVQAERPRRPEKVRTIIRRQEELATPADLAGRLRYLDLRGEGPLWGPGTGRQFAGREQERLVQFRCARILLFSHRFGCL